MFEHACAPARFERRSFENDGVVDVSDAVYLLRWLFLGWATPECIAAMNTNGDARADVSDATYLLIHLFLEGPAPVAPYPRCGPGALPTDGATCEAPPANCKA